MILVKLFLTFVKIGLFTVGSGYSMLVLTQRYIVDTYHWLTLQEFSDVVAIAEITPGPIMINLATFVGTKIAGFKGAFFATLGLIIIPFLSLYIIALNYPQIKSHPLIARLLNIVRPMAIGFITVAIINLGKTSITGIKSGLIAVIVIILTCIFKVNPIFTVLGGIVLGMMIK